MKDNLIDISGVGIVFIVIASAAVYAPLCRRIRGFCFDDIELFAAIAGANGKGFRWWWYAGQRRLLWVTYRLSWYFCGRRPQGWLLGNMALHIVNALVLLQLAEFFGLSHGGAVTAALALMIHPKAVMAVATVSGRSSLLCSTLWLLGLLAAVHGQVLWTTGLGASSLLVKEEGILFPVMLMGVALVCR